MEKLCLMKSQVTAPNRERERERAWTIDLTFNMPTIVKNASAILSRYDGGICERRHNRTGVITNKC